VIEVTFQLRGVPENWLNSRLHHMKAYAMKADWMQQAMMLGAVARQQAKVRPANSSDRRFVVIWQYRHGVLDDDGLLASAKPIIDGLKTFVKKRFGAQMVSVPGAGLIWDDDPEHATWVVNQYRIGKKMTTMTIVSVRDWTEEYR
jgi:hypothetical protein